MFRGILKSIGLATSIAMLSSIGAFAQGASFPSLSEAEVVPGQFIIKNAPGVNALAVAKTLAARNFEVIETLPLTGVQIVTAPEQAFNILAREVQALDGIAYIEPVYRVQIDVTPNDPQYPAQWGYPIVKAPDAWDVRVDSGDVVIAVIDTGVDYKHPDLTANMWTNPGEIPNNGIDDDNNGIVDDVYGANFVSANATGDPMDDNRHGTHVAGTIGAVSDNNLGVAGVNWKTKIMALKFLSASGGGTTAGAIRAIEYGIRMKANVMNNSWGGGGFSRALEDAIRAADSAGILFLAAAGNNGTDNDISPHYPSNYDVPNVLAIMATDQNDAKPAFSEFGATTVDMAAPGVDILSTIPGGNYDEFSGTSMATPHAAGAAALVWAANPGMTHIDVKKHLMDTAEVIPGLAGLSVTGARLNLGKAMGGGGKPAPTPPPAAVCKSTQHAQTAYNEFFWSASKQVSQNSNLLSVTFDLPEKMAVNFSAHGSARRIKGSGNTVIRTGIYNQSSANTMWTGSYRRVSFDNPNDNKIVSSDFSITLPAGQHTIYWKLWVSGATLQFDSGTLTVSAFPCVMGGKLKLSAAATMTDVTEADPASHIQVENLNSDAMGNSVTTDN